MGSKHTPGPWISSVGLNLNRGTYGRISRVKGETRGRGDFAPIADILIPEGEDWGMAEADARLIAAAPCLLSALSELASFCADALDAGILHEQEMQDSGLLERAYQAIAKADGR